MNGRLAKVTSIAMNHWSAHAFTIFSRPLTTFFVAFRVSITSRECSTMNA
jgi:hypothetical protein